MDSIWDSFCSMHITLMPLQILPHGGCTLTAAGSSVAQIESQLFLGAVPPRLLLQSSMRSHISFWYCLFCWSNWIPSVAYNESLLDLFSPLKYLFLLNAGFPWITRLNLKTCICPLAPVIDLFFFPFFLSFFFFSRAVSVSLLFQQRIIGLLLCVLPP